MLQGGVIETVMLGGNYYIYQLCEHEFYDWVIFRYKSIQYPDENIVLGRYLWPKIDVGSAMTAKIIKVNGEVVHRSTYCELKED